ncbi:MAG: methionyl-tRNA formyltransferase [Ignavibacteria bacterium GWF2_33_9]|nr:MAG: methionyl-tRNA formyltransferase [Ignavibacteria bacterium GWF2_33_9]
MLINPRIIFFGTPEIAVPVLETVAEKYNVVAVVTNEDKPQGRGKKVTPCEVKIAAEKLNLPILQPDSLKDTEFHNQLRAFEADIFLVFAFKILPSEILAIPFIGSFNIHPSILPKYRGAAPINHTIINGDTETGITTFLLEEKVDAGGILLQDEFTIAADITAGDLYEIVMQKAPAIAIRTIERLAQGNKSIQKQNPDLVSKAPKIFRENCELDFSKTAYDVKNFINGVSPVPGAWKIWGGKNMKFLRAKLPELDISLESGEYLIDNKRFYIGCADRCIEILELQPETKKQMSFKDFLNGYRGEARGKVE